MLEPLVDLYKPQVRAVGEKLDLAREVYERRPFPGPGLSVRMIGEVTPTRVETVRKATKVVEEYTAGLKCFQAFAVLMNDRATGLHGKERKFGEIIVVRAVNSKDALTADATRIPWEMMEKIRDRILKELPSVVKVLYDITPKPPSTIEYI